MVVRPHDENAVLRRDRDDERPEDERQNPERGLWCELHADGLDDRLQRVERARPEIAEDDAERGERGSGRSWLNDARRNRVFSFNFLILGASSGRRGSPVAVKPHCRKTANDHATLLPSVVLIVRR